jgi:hypothetical protein
MKKHTAIHLLGGSMARAARAIGCSKQAVQRWPVDEHDTITSKRVADAVLAALVRRNYLHRVDDPNGTRMELDEATLDDLMYLPTDVIDADE